MDNGGANNDVLESNTYSNRKMWRCVTELTNNYKQQPPRILNIDGVFTTSLRKITNACNIFFVSKIALLKENFRQNVMCQ